MDVVTQQAVVERECERFRVQLQSSVAPDWPVRVRAVLTHFHAHLFDPDLRVGDACRACGIHSGGFRRTFKRHCHQTMHRYCEDKRLLAALRLLGFEGVEIGCIAFGIGYANYRTFGRAFKRCLGESPAALRRRLCRDLKLSHVAVETDPYVLQQHLTL